MVPAWGKAWGKSWGKAWGAALTDVAAPAAPTFGGGGYHYPRRQSRTPDEIGAERIRLGIIPPDVEKAVEKAVETVIARRGVPSKATDLQAAEMALRGYLAQQDRQITGAIRQALRLEYAKQELEFEDAQIAMLLFDM